MISRLTVFYKLIWWFQKEIVARRSEQLSSFCKELELYLFDCYQGKPTESCFKSSRKNGKCGLGRERIIICLLTE
jgi:hypothetical protein